MARSKAMKEEMKEVLRQYIYILKVGRTRRKCFNNFSIQYIKSNLIQTLEMYSGAYTRKGLYPPPRGQILNFKHESFFPVAEKGLGYH